MRTACPARVAVVRTRLGTKSGRPVPVIQSLRNRYRASPGSGHGQKRQRKGIPHSRNNLRNAQLTDAAFVMPSWRWAAGGGMLLGELLGPGLDVQTLNTTGSTSLLAAPDTVEFLLSCGGHHLASQ